MCVSVRIRVSVCVCVCVCVCVSHKWDAKSESCSLKPEQPTACTADFPCSSPPAEQPLIAPSDTEEPGAAEPGAAADHRPSESGTLLGHGGPVSLSRVKRKAQTLTLSRPI